MGRFKLEAVPDFMRWVVDASARKRNSLFSFSRERLPRFTFKQMVIKPVHMDSISKSKKGMQRSWHFKYKGGIEELVTVPTSWWLSVSYEQAGAHELYQKANGEIAELLIVP